MKQHQTRCYDSVEPVINMLLSAREVVFSVQNLKDELFIYAC